MKKFLSDVLIDCGLTVNGTTSLVGTATANTVATSDNSTKIATTAWVKSLGYTSYSHWNLKTNGVQRTTVTSGGTLDITAGTGVTVGYGAGGIVTINATGSVDYISNVVLNGSSLDFTGVGNAFAGSVDLSTLNPIVRTVYETVKNVSGATILKGTPLAVVPGQTSGNISDVVPADAAAPAKMPAVFIANENIADEAEGEAVLFGYLSGVDTSLYQSGTTVYVAPGGGWTATKPVYPNKIQNLGVITKQHATNGAGIVTGVGRANDLPNLTTGKIWVGTANYPIESTTVHIDETNGRLGIGTTAPAAALEIVNANNPQLRIRNGVGGASIDIQSSGSSESRITWGSNGQISGTGGDFNIDAANVDLVFRTAIGSSERMRITPAGNVGIGTNSPTSKLDVSGTISITGTNTTGQESILLQFNAGSDQLGSIRTYNAGGYNQHTRFYTSNVSGTGETLAFMYDQAGNVGIGTTSPAYKLDVAGTAKIKGTTTSTTAESFKITDSSGNTVFQVLDNGNVGINTNAETSTSYRLRVNGGIWANSFEQLNTLNGTAGVGRIEYYNTGGSHRTLGFRTYGSHPAESVKGFIEISSQVLTYSGMGNVVLHADADFADHPTLVLRSLNTAADSFYMQNYHHDLGALFITKATTGGDDSMRFRPGRSNDVLVVNTGGIQVDGTISKVGGTSAQFLKADGSVDSTTYLSALPAHTHDASDIVSGTLNSSRIPTPLSGNWWNNGYVKVLTDGVSEIGRYVDWHFTNASTSDYDYRMYLTDASTLNFSANATFNGGVTVGDSSSDVFKSNGTTYLAALGNNVGIGTTSPNHKVDIYSNENVPLRIHRPSNANLDSSGAWGIGFSTRSDANNSTTDTRAGIFSYYNGNLFLAAANTSIVADPDAYARLTILNTGYVGIGTTSPTHKLHVAGSVNIEDDLTFGIGGFLGTSSSVFEMFSLGDIIYNADSNNNGNSNHIFRESGNELMRITSDGNVGIGTISPGEKLHVNGRNILVGDLKIGRANSVDDSGGDAVIAIGKQALNTYTGNTSNMTAVGDYALAATTNSGTSNDAFGYKALFENTTGTYNSAFGQSAGRKNNGTQNVFFGQYSGPYYATLTGGYNTFIGPLSGIQSNGAAAKNTGIGASTLYSLTTGIENVAISSAALFDVTTGSGNIGIGFNTGRGITTGSYNIVIGNNVTGLSATLANNIIIADGQGNRRINVDASGKVGIGTTSPAANLHVNGTWTSDRGTISINGPANALTGIGITSNNIYRGGLIHRDGTAGQSLELTAYSSEYLLLKTANTTRLAITPVGNIGIGTTSPSEKLHVVGNVQIDGSSTSTVLETGDKGAAPTGAAFAVYPIASTYGAIVDYVIYDTNRDNMRTGTFSAVWNTGITNFNDVSTVDIGDTSVVTLTSQINGADVELIVSGDAIYTIKFNLKLIK